MKIEKYKCDMCEREVSPRILNTFSRDTFFVWRPEKFDICDDCLKEIKSMVKKTK